MPDTNTPQSTDTRANQIAESSTAIAALQSIFGRPTQRRSGYLLRVELDTWSPPAITRMLRIPTNLTFHELHQTLQIAFGWRNKHGYSFEVYTSTEPGHVMSIMYRFELYTPSDGEPEQKADEDITLEQVLERPGWKEDGLTITYVYDGCEEWEHEIQLLGTADPRLGAEGAIDVSEDSQAVFCFGGEGHEACDDDFDGKERWEELKVSTRSRR